MNFEKRKALAAISIAVLISENEKNKRKKRTCWVKPWLKRRDQLGCYHTLVKELRIEDKNSYRTYLRMPHDVFVELLNAVEPIIKKQDTVLRNAIPVDEKLALTLRFLATGESMQSLHIQFRLGLSTVHNIINETTSAIYEALRGNYLKFPSTAEEWLQIAKDFEDIWQCYHCIGAMDGKHISITAPPNSGSTYFNYKQTFSIVLLALVDANLKAIYVDVGCNGRAHDSSVFNASKLGQLIIKKELPLPPPEPLPGRTLPVPYSILSDEAFALRENVLRPYSKREILTLSKRAYNYRHCRGRRVSEIFFGNLVNRFRLFLKPIQALPDNVVSYVLAAVVLHNCLRHHTGSTKLFSEIYNSETDGNLPSIPAQGCRSSPQANVFRDELKEFYCNEGSVDFQWDRLKEY